MRAKQKTLGLLRTAAVCGVLWGGGWFSSAARGQINLTPAASPPTRRSSFTLTSTGCDTKAYEKYLAKLITEATGNLPPEILQLKQAAGVDVQDLHDITAYTLSDPNHLLFLVHAKMDPARIVAAIKKEVGESAEVSYGKYKVLHWGDGDEAAFATFHDDGRLVVAGPTRTCTRRSTRWTARRSGSSPTAFSPAGPRRQLSPASTHQSGRCCLSD